MVIANRMKKIRKDNKLSQAAFGERLGVSRDVVNNIENGRVDVSEIMVKAVCEEFGINFEWLRYGKGEMFSESDDRLLSSLSQQYGLDSLDRKIIEAYINLPDMQRGVIKGFVRNLVDSVLADENYEEYREDYIKSKAAPIAARHGNIDGLQEAADLYDMAKEGDKDE